MNTTTTHGETVRAAREKRATARAHGNTPTCSAFAHAHWTAHTLACKTRRQEVLAAMACGARS